MSEEHDLKRTMDVMTDKRPILIQTDVAGAWLVLSAVQYAYRDPHLSEAFKHILRLCGDRYEEMIVDHHPEITDLIEKGWNPDYDVRR